MNTKVRMKKEIKFTKVAYFDLCEIAGKEITAIDESYDKKFFLCICDSGLIDIDKRDVE